MSEIPNIKASIFVSIKKLTHILFAISDLVPKKYRFTLVDKMINISFESLQFAVYANNGLKEDRIKNITLLINHIETINLMTEILIETKHYDTNHNYIFICPKNISVQLIEVIASIKKQSSGWKNWLSKEL